MTDCLEFSLCYWLSLVPVGLMAGVSWQAVTGVCSLLLIVVGVCLDSVVLVGRIGFVLTVG